MWRALSCLAIFLAACPVDDGTDDDDDTSVAPVSGAYGCDGGTASPEWTFELSVVGLVSAESARVFVETPAQANPSGYAMVLAGQPDATHRDFSATLAGTAEGAVPAVGDVPYHCGELSDVTVQLCFQEQGVPEQLCWACGDKSEGEPPGGAQGWLDCGSE